jgi:carbamoyl-phosphate synthase/aspartate carbamoyltransferase/dihydroorotase
MRLPGLIDIHVHMRVPGADHKENWQSGTAAALAGGITTVLTMPNTTPSITKSASLKKVLEIANNNSYVDFGQFLGAGPENMNTLSKIKDQAAGLKMYLDSTFGDLRLDEIGLWMQHFEKWNSDIPIAIHAEKKSMAAAILIADLYNQPVHICHVSTKEEIELIRRAKEKGIPITCEVTPHHMFLTQKDIPDIGIGRGEVRPVLASEEDQIALWKNFDVIDCIATDHAPHTLEEKDSKNPPPGFPGLETALPLLLTAVKQGQLSIEDIIKKMHTNPARIFNIPTFDNTYIEIDPDEKWTIKGIEQITKCGWTPFEGWKVQGKVRKVVLRGETAYENGKILIQPGYGKNIRKQN